MPTISRQQAYDRFISLPEEIQDLLLAEKTNTAIEYVAELKHLPEEKRGSLFTATGDVIMGFIHGQDAPQEIARGSGIPIELAREIWNEIDQRIVRPYRDTIDRLYEPPKSILGARPMADIKTQPTQAGAFSATMKIGTPSVARPGSAPAPFVIHEESKVESAGKTPSLASFSANQNISEIKVDTPAPPKPAKLEIGGIAAEQPKQPVVSKQEISAPKVVHYSEFEARVNTPAVPSVPASVPIAPQKITPSAPAVPPPPPKAPNPTVAVRINTPSAAPKPAAPIPPAPPAPKPAQPPIATVQPPKPPQPAQTQSPAPAPQKPGMVIDLSFLGKQSGSDEVVGVIIKPPEKQPPTPPQQPAR